MKTEDSSIAEQERLALRALCRGTTEGPLGERARALLRGYRWRDPLHQLIFDGIARIPGASPHTLRERLPSLLTRRGFPDVEWEIIFERLAMSQEDAERLIRELVAR